MREAGVHGGPSSIARYPPLEHADTRRLFLQSLQVLSINLQRRAGHLLGGKFALHSVATLASQLFSHRVVGKQFLQCIR